MTKFICLFAGPGAGKSTIAAGVFSQLKQKGISCELIQEYAKDVTWERTTVLLENQLHIFAEQFRRQFRLLNNVDYVITDSPLMLSCIYNDVFFKMQEGKRWHTDKYHHLSNLYFFEAANQFENINFYVDRAKNYQNDGRNQTLEQAKTIDNSIRQFLDNNRVQYNLTDSVKGIGDVMNSVLADISKETNLKKYDTTCNQKKRQEGTC